MADWCSVIETTCRASLELATTRSSSPRFPSCICLFDMGWGSLIWFLKLLQEDMESLMMLTWQRSWFPSSRVKLPFVEMSASWFLVSTYFIWILGSMFILSNHQSSSTLWVRDTCLIVGLLPLIIILITASFSSKNSQGTEARKLCVWSDVINMCPAKIYWRVRLFLRSFVGMFSQCLSRNNLLRALGWFEGTCDYFNNQIPGIKSR